MTHFLFLLSFPYPVGILSRELNRKTWYYLLTDNFSFLGPDLAGKKSMKSPARLGTTHLHRGHLTSRDIYRALYRLWKSAGSVAFISLLYSLSSHWGIDPPESYSIWYVEMIRYRQKSQQCRERQIRKKDWNLYSKDGNSIDLKNIRSGKMLPDFLPAARVVLTMSFDCSF